MKSKSLQKTVLNVMATLMLMLFVPVSAFAQMTVKGVVVDQTGEPVIGASARVQGTTNGTITDFDGNFTINNVKEGDNIEVSYVGYLTQVLPAKASMNIVLEEDNKMLEDVIVVGYGVQKKSVVTAAIAKVSSEDLANKTPVRVDNALKGLAAGVNVTSSSGQPGAQPKVRIRGNGTINNSDPLYIIDGMPADNGGLDYLNPSDIESIEVLKDAASGAIYGARAANGVVLVTTKKGKEGKASISYNFSYGWQSKARKRDVTSATDYAILQNEKYVNGGMAPLYADPYHLIDANGDAIQGFGTDWQDLVFNDNAPVINHDMSISGATDKLNYYLSMGYYTQEGIVGGNYGKSNYNRLSMRSNNKYTVFDESKDRTFLNKLEVGVNLAYARIKSSGIDTNSEWGSVLGSALYMAPLLPVTITNPTVAQEMRDSHPGYELISDANGDPYTVPGNFGSFQEINNPLAMLNIPSTMGWSHKFTPSFTVDLQLWDNLKYHFSYNAEMAFWGNEGATLSKYYLSGNNKQEHTSASAYKANNQHWQIENTLSYDKTIDKHSFSVVLGQSAYKSKGDQLGGSRWHLVNVNKPSIDYATGNVVDGVAEFSVYGGPYVEHRMSSLFGRISYNYAEKYMFQATVRRDGSSRFGSNNKYGVFPSASLGWNVTNEDFMENTKDWLSNMKIRASWGKNGNDNIGDFRYTVLTSMGNNVLFGNVAQKYNGSKASGLANPDLKWEESEQTDLGVDFGFLNNSLTFTVDYYIKKTNGMIITMPIPSYVGETKPLGNVGDMENSGVEFELGYKWNIADAHFSVKGNATYLKNELKNLGNTEGFLNLDNVQSLGTCTRAENGQPFPFFYGYKTNGIFQNWDEVKAYTNADGGMIQPNAQPGDIRFVDVNGDGQITADDRTNIGNGTPKWTFGVNLNADWKGFDFNLFVQGVSGADVLDGTYRNDISSGNYPTWMLARWTGEGTSNKYPRLALGDTDNWQISDLYVCDGSYFRIKNISLGYTLPKKLTKIARIERLRVYGMAENLVTWTKYWGFDPEISSGGTSLGVDKGVYPQARTFTVGANITF